MEIIMLLTVLSVLAEGAALYMLHRKQQRMREKVKQLSYRAWTYGTRLLVIEWVFPGYLERRNQAEQIRSGKGGGAEPAKKRKRDRMPEVPEY